MLPQSGLRFGSPPSVTKWCPEALRSRVAAGPLPVKAEAALRGAGPLLSAPVADRTNWTLARLAEEIERQEGVTISRSQLSKVLRRKGG